MTHGGRPCVGGRGGVGVCGLAVPGGGVLGDAR